MNLTPVQVIYYLISKLAFNNEFLVLDFPPTIPVLSSVLLSARYRLHDAVMSRCDSFKWLSDLRQPICDEDAPIEPHALHNPDCRLVRMTTEGQLVIAVTSLRRALCYDSSIYSGSYKSWIEPVAQFFPLNPTKCFRLVIF